MNVEQRKMFYERLKDNILEVHYISDQDTYHEIECTLEDTTLWDETKDEITVWNVIDQNSRTFNINNVIEYILRTWDEEGDLDVFDYTKEDDFVIL
jgi:hypothetical protein